VCGGVHNKSTAPGWCFVAGTPVHTKEGLVPIEKLRAGDLVLSQPQMKGELCYRHVLQTRMFEEREVFRFTYYRDGLPNDYKEEQPPEEAAHDLYHPFWGDHIETLVVTADHPFWTPDIGFTAVDNLMPGNGLELSDGGSATIWQLEMVFETDQPGVGWSRHGRMEEPGRLIDFRNDSVTILAEEVYRDTGARLKCRVYNIEVEGTHTYYVGRIGAWVHDTEGLGS
jgi:hypothetical protein